MGANPTVGQVEDYRKDAQADQQYGDPSQPTLHQPYAAPKEVANKDHRRGPDGSSQDVVEDEGPPAHPAYASDQGTEDAQAGEEACKEYGFAPVPPEERLGASQPLGGDEDVAPPPQDEGSPPLAPDPVADLVTDNGTQDAEHYGITEVEVPPLGEDTSCQENRLTGQRHSGALKHHPKEDEQVAVLFDEREDPIHSRRVQPLPKTPGL